MLYIFSRLAVVISRWDIVSHRQDTVPETGNPKASRFLSFLGSLALYIVFLSVLALGMSALLRKGGEIAWPFIRNPFLEPLLTEQVRAVRFLQGEDPYPVPPLSRLEAAVMACPRYLVSSDLLSADAVEATRIYWRFVLEEAFFSERQVWTASRWPVSEPCFSVLLADLLDVPSGQEDRIRRFGPRALASSEQIYARLLGLVGDETEVLLRFLPRAVSESTLRLPFLVQRLSRGEKPLADERAIMDMLADLVLDGRSGLRFAKELQQRLDREWSEKMIAIIAERRRFRARR